MSHGFKVLFSGLIIGMFALVACGSPAVPAAAPSQLAPAAPAGGATNANPASENCVKQGGKLTIEKRGEAASFGVCWFEDALQCEEWALMRGECPAGGLKVTGYGPQGRYCAITGRPVHHDGWRHDQRVKVPARLRMARCAMAPTTSTAKCTTQAAPRREVYQPIVRLLVHGLADSFTARPWLEEIACPPRISYLAQTVNTPAR